MPMAHALRCSYRSVASVGRNVHYCRLITDFDHIDRYCASRHWLLWLRESNPKSNSSNPLVQAGLRYDTDLDAAPRQRTSDRGCSFLATNDNQPDGALREISTACAMLPSQVRTSAGALSPDDHGGRFIPGHARRYRARLRFTHRRAVGTQRLQQQIRRGRLIDRRRRRCDQLHFLSRLVVMYFAMRQCPRSGNRVPAPQRLPAPNRKADPVRCRRWGSRSKRNSSPSIPASAQGGDRSPDCRRCKFARCWGSERRFRSGTACKNNWIVWRTYKSPWCCSNLWTQVSVSAVLFPPDDATIGASVMFAPPHLSAPVRGRAVVCGIPHSGQGIRRGTEPCWREHARSYIRLIVAIQSRLS